MNIIYERITGLLLEARLGKIKTGLALGAACVGASCAGPSTQTPKLDLETRKKLARQKEQETIRQENEAEKLRWRKEFGPGSEIHQDIQRTNKENQERVIKARQDMTNRLSNNPEAWMKVMQHKLRKPSKGSIPINQYKAKFKDQWGQQKYPSTMHNIDDPKLVANWILGDFSAILNKFDVEANDSKVDAIKFAELLTYLKEEKISGQATKKVLENIWENSDLSVSKSIQDLGLEQISDDNEIEEIIEKVINNNPDQKEQFLSGKDRLFGFFVGQVMKESKGKANPKLVNEILKKKLV